MLELREIRKSYKTGSFVQTALDGVSIVFRDCEFVAVLGASGSGKTTLLNILGGLDHADDGDLLINGTSTKKYRSSDWDTYRNHRIGFIFQSYNLIPHQTILSNVELALTLSGVSRAERKRRAAEALVEVGLEDHLHKKPSQLSGGQMQRVAIARALVNDPDIVLADEPTGALDTTTGLQVMDLLSEIAHDRLVIMVTHNPELAETYATRIVKLHDGRITDDSRPFSPEETARAVVGAVDASHVADASDAEVTAPLASTVEADAATPRDATVPQADTTALMPAAIRPEEDAEHGKRSRKASMSFLTALSLSFNNLMTKKGRTFMTAFAGSIGIIGIAAILALSNGVNNYIAKVEEDTLSSYPLSITSSSYDLTAMLTDSSTSSSDASGDVQDMSPKAASSANVVDDTSSLIPESTIVSDMFAQIKTNDLASFKTFLESGDSDIDQYVNAIDYDYGITPQIYKTDTADGVVQLNPSSISSLLNSSASSSSSFGSSMMSTSSFSEMLDDTELLDSQYDVVDGRWPENYDECILVLSKSGKINDFTLYNMGVLDPSELKEMAEKALKAETVDVPDNEVEISYDDVLGMSFSVVNSCDMYKYNEEYGTWTDMSEDTDYLSDQIANGTTLKIVGIVQPRSDTNSPALQQGIAYSSKLTTHLMEEAAESDIVKQQIADPDTDVFTGKTFDELKDENKGVDLSSMFSIDEDAIQNAIKVDTSAFDTSSMDMGSMDASSLDMSSLTSGIDMESIMSNMPSPDFSSMEVTMTDEEKQGISTLQGQIIAGFLPYWFAQHPTETITETTDLTADLQAYMQSESVQTSLSQMALIMGQATSTAVESAMQDYMANTFTPYLTKAMTTMVTQMATSMASQMADAMTSAVEQSMNSLSGSMANAISVDGNAFADAIHFNMTQDDLTSLLTNYANASSLTYDNNLATLGYAQEDSPKEIDIYPIDFDAKEQVLSIIDDYNNQMKDAGKDDQVISYSDIMGVLMSSVTDIVNMISLVLIAFVSISLVVSSIMIGIITYISVLERKKEIGILRAMGASKRNIANVFNAETFIEGLIAGVFAIAVVLLASIPVNAYVENVHHVTNVMSLPWSSALILIGISVALTLIAGIIPSSAASRRDPVEALRSE